MTFQDTAQVLLGPFVFGHSTQSGATETTALIPLYAAALSLVQVSVLLLVQAVTRKRSKHSLGHAEDPAVDAPSRSPVPLRGHASTVVSAGAQFVTSVTLLALSTAGTGRSLALFEISFYAYTTSLGLLVLLLRPDVGRLLTRHVTALLFVALGVLAWRDLYPLLTFTRLPVDGATWLTWTRLGLLALGGFLIPLVTPTQYIPADLLNPNVPSTEQTASYLSLFTYSFLDPLILKARNVPHLPGEELPVLADTDNIAHPKNVAWKSLDPTLKPVKGRHIFFSLLRFHSLDYLKLFIGALVKVVLKLAGPFTLSRLLLYLETGGEGMTLRPWVWILLLALAPIAYTINDQAYLWRLCRVFVRTEAILTQLLFEHALRIRMKDDTRSAPSTSTATTAVQTPVTPAVELPDERTNEASENTVVVAEDNQSQTSTSKGKEQAESDDSSANSHIVGKITNLVSTDMKNIAEGMDFVDPFVITPLQIGLSVVLLYHLLGWSALVGLVTMLITLPLPGRVALVMNKVQEEGAKKTDARVQAVSETIGVIRMIKMFGWEKKVEAQVREKRETELQYTWKYFLCGIVQTNVNQVLPLLTMIATFATYTLIMKQELTASRIFSSIAVFDVIRDRIWMTFYELNLVISARVSLNRVNSFLNDTELLDRYTGATQNAALTPLPPRADPSTIGFRNATFAWTNDLPTSGSGAATPSRRNFKLRISGDLFFQSGKINLIIGPTGCGKTSLVMALLGELHFQPESIDSFVNLPRDGGLAYAAQEAWILNATVKENILFGTPFDEERYQKVLRQCALERDLTLFEAGDQTEIGEKGVTLSGGQKARVSLARAIYSSAQILLLDDVLSALDVHTSRKIVDDCFRGELVQGRTLILVTHNVALTSPIADFVVSLGLDGRIRSQGNVADALAKDVVLSKEVHLLEEVTDKEESTVDADGTEDKVDKPKGQLVAKEEIAEGRVTWGSFVFYFGSFGGAGFWIAFLAAVVLSEWCIIAQTWWLGYWSRQYAGRNPLDVDVPWYLGIYGLIIVAALVIYTPGIVLYNYGQIRGARRVHERLLKAIIGTNLRWLDSTPTGRIMTRFTQDMRSIDAYIGGSFNALVELGTSLIFKFGAVLIYAPSFLFPGLGIAGFGYWLGRLYMNAQMSAKRELSNARSPVLSHFGASIAGLTSIRAFGVEEAFKDETMKRVNAYTRFSRTYWNLNRWIAVRIDTLGGFFSSALAAYLVYGGRYDPSTTGFSLAMALAFTSIILYWVRILNSFEVQCNSIERIKGYVDIEQEPESTEAGTPPAYWPASGSLHVEKVCAKYSPDGPEVLHEVSFTIKSGEHVGVVGRTGAGKSSLSLALLRMIPTTGKVIFDGSDVSKLNLDALRSNITIIPQQPELISGSLRQNLDPFGEHDDATLNSCLRSAGLFNLQSEDDESKIGLDTIVASGGSNFSVGQRQIIALARAMARRSKVYLFDEATASVDNETDAAIQEVIKTEFKDVTLVIVAHRLQTIMTADKILVLDAGKVIEFDSPQALLKKDGTFKALVDGSGDRELLYEMARRQN